LIAWVASFLPSIIDGWSFDAPKTRDAKAALAALGIEGKALLVIDRDDENAILSFRNLPEIQLIETAELNAYDVLCNEWIVFTEATLPRAKPDTEASKPDTETSKPDTETEEK
jgi:large subunit ribosomal protein L4